jgi:hypothetical protein
MNDIMKIMLIVVVGFCGWKFYKGDFNLSKSKSGAVHYSNVSKVDLIQAKQNADKAQKEYASIQKNEAARTRPELIKKSASKAAAAQKKYSEMLASYHEAEAKRAAAIAAKKKPQ